MIGNTDMTGTLISQDSLNAIENNLKIKIEKNGHIANRYRSMIRGMSLFLLILTITSFGLSIANLIHSARLAFPDIEELRTITRAGEIIQRTVMTMQPAFQTAVVSSLFGVLIGGGLPYLMAWMASFLSAQPLELGSALDRKSVLDHRDILDYIARRQEIEKLKSGDLSQLEKKYRPLEAPKQNLLFLLAPIGVHLAVVLTSILISTLLFSNPVTSPIMIAMIVLSGTYLAVSAAKAYATKKEHDAFLQSFRDLAAEFGFDREGKQPIQEIVSALNQEIITAVNPVEEPLDSLVSEIKAQGLTFSDQHIKTDTDQIGTNGSLKKKDGFDARPVNHLVL